MIQRVVGLTIPEAEDRRSIKGRRKGMLYRPGSAFFETSEEASNAGIHASEPRSGSLIAPFSFEALELPLGKFHVIVDPADRNPRLYRVSQTPALLRLVGMEPRGLDEESIRAGSSTADEFGTRLPYRTENEQWCGKVSPVAPLSLGEADKAAFRIPSTAQSHAFCYPLGVIRLRPGRND